MHYVALIHRAGKEPAERQVEIAETAPDKYRITVDGRAFEVDAKLVSDTTIHALVDHHGYNIEFEQNRKGGENLLVRGHILHVEVLDLRKMSVRKAHGAAVGPAGPAEITSPMPGKVVAVLVKDGQEVQPGQGLVVVEAMKMENELRAPRAGTVRRLNASVGTAIDSGAVLCVVE